MPRAPVRRIVVHFPPGQENHAEADARAEKFAGSNAMAIDVHEVAKLDAQTPVCQIYAGPCFTVVGFGKKATASAHVSSTSIASHFIPQIIAHAGPKPVFAVAGPDQSRSSTELVEEIRREIKKHGGALHQRNVWWDEVGVNKSLVVTHKPGRIHVFPSTEKHGA